MQVSPSTTKTSIPLQKGYQAPLAINYISQVLASGKTGGNGLFTQKCHAWFEEKFGFASCLLTSSCTDALEMAALLLEIGPGDEVVVPSYNFPSAANAFLLRGAKVVYAEASADYPVMDAEAFAAAISPRTKAVVLMHYAGFPGDLSKILAIAKQHNIRVVEDAAHALGASYKGKPLGTFGDLACFSFHETKNIAAGEGGMLVVNRTEYAEKAEELWQMGTNRAAYQKGLVGGYHWKGIGSSFLPSDVTAAYLYAQLESYEDIQQKRQHLWQRYFKHLRTLPRTIISLPELQEGVSHAAHIFYLIMPTEKLRSKLQDMLAAEGIASAAHYNYLEDEALRMQGLAPLTYQRKVAYDQQLLRLPLYTEMREEEQNRVIKTVNQFVYLLEN